MTPSAHALDFSFEFNNVNGNVNGVVSGRILGLADNTAGQAASNIFIDSVPAIFSPVGSVPFPGGFTNDVLNWPIFQINTFSVSAGVITAYDVRWSTATGGMLLFISDTQFGGQAFFGEDTNNNGFASDRLIGSVDLGPPQNLTFRPLTNNQIPEPSTILLLGSGLVGLVAWRKRKLQA
jgi:hypothetical protein